MGCGVLDGEGSTTYKLRNIIDKTADHSLPNSFLMFLLIYLLITIVGFAHSCHDTTLEDAGGLSLDDTERFGQAFSTDVHV